jgi:threonine dehydrogenase-like Zn-dependent dehydrogenase
VLLAERLKSQVTDQNGVLTPIPSASSVSVILSKVPIWPAAIRFLDRTRLDLSPIRTHEFLLGKGIEAFALGQQPDKCIKVTLLNA